MAQAVRTDLLTPADTLRDLLTRCEKRVISPQEGGGVAELFAWMDAIAGLWPDIEASGIDARAERSRWESLQAQLQRRAGKLVDAWGGPQALVKARAALSPDRLQWWWWLDELVAANRRRRTGRIAVGALVLVAAALGAYFLFNALFPVDPQVRALHRLRLDIDAALQAGEFAQARALAEQAATLDPNAVDALLLSGALAEAMGDPGSAEEAWARGRQVLDDEATFLMSRGSSYLQAGLPEQAIRDELAAIDMAPDMAPAYFFLGVGYEQIGALGQAIDALQQASDLAGEDNPQLAVAARTRLAVLLQQPVLPTSVTVTGTP